MTSQIPCRNLIAHSRTPENDVAKRLPGCDPHTCLRRRGRRTRSSMSSSVALQGNDRGAFTRRVLLKAHPKETLPRTGVRAKKWRPAGRVIEKRAAAKKGHATWHDHWRIRPDNELVGVTPLQSTAFAQAPTCQPTAADLRSNRVTYWPFFRSSDTATGRAYDATNL